MGKVIYDAEASIELRDIDAAAITATATGDEVAFDWNAPFAVAVNVSAIDTADGNETYALTIESVDSAGANAVTQYTLPALSATGNYMIYIDGETAKKFDADAAGIQIKATLGGTSPSLTYGAWIMPMYGAAGRP